MSHNYFYLVYTDSREFPNPRLKIGKTCTTLKKRLSSYRTDDVYAKYFACIKLLVGDINQLEKECLHATKQYAPMYALYPLNECRYGVNKEDLWQICLDTIGHGTYSYVALSDVEIDQEIVNDMDEKKCGGQCSVQSGTQSNPQNDGQNPSAILPIAPVIPVVAATNAKVEQANKQTDKRQLSLRDAILSVLKSGAKMTVEDIWDKIEEEKLWTSPKGKTPKNSCYQQTQDLEKRHVIKREKAVFDGKEIYEYYIAK